MANRSGVGVAGGDVAAAFGAESGVEPVAGTPGALFAGNYGQEVNSGTPQSLDDYGAVAGARWYRRVPPLPVGAVRAGA